MYQHRVGGLKLKGKRVERPVQAVSTNGNHAKAERTIDPAFAGKDADQLVRDFLPIVRRIATELVLRNPAALDAEDAVRDQDRGVHQALHPVARLDARASGILRAPHEREGQRRHRRALSTARARGCP